MKKTATAFLILAVFSYLYCANFKDMSNIQEEIWKDIPGWEGYYQASYSGKIRSVDRVIVSKDTIHKERRTFHKGRILKTVPNRLGYMMCYPSFGGPKSRTKKMCCTVHRLVASAWIPEIEGKNEINHIDGNKANNSVPNLERCTRLENMRHAHEMGLIKYRTGGKKVQQMTISGESIAIHDGIMEAEKATGIGFRQISRAALGQRKTTGGFKWAYL